MESDDDMKDVDIEEEEEEVEYEVPEGVENDLGSFKAKITDSKIFYAISALLIFIFKSLTWILSLISW